MSELDHDGFVAQLSAINDLLATHRITAINHVTLLADLQGCYVRAHGADGWGQVVRDATVGSVR